MGDVKERALDALDAPLLCVAERLVVLSPVRLCEKRGVV